MIYAHGISKVSFTLQENLFPFAMYKKKLIHAFRCGLSYDAFGKFREHT